MNLALCHADADAAFAARLLGDLAALGVVSCGLEEAKSVLLLASAPALAQQEVRAQAARSTGLLVVLLDEISLPADLLSAPLVDFRDRERYGAAFYRLCVRLGLRPIEAGEASQVARPRRWHCIFCGWRCSDPEHNSYLCHRCKKLRPLMADACTCIQCLLCNELSLAAGSFCEWCGERLGAVEA